MLPGQILRNRYKIIKPLGSGSFGITYLAEDLDLPDHPQCVVKNLRQSQNQEELQAFINYFNKEAKALYRLGREYSQIPQLFAHFEEGGEFYLVQEYIDGYDLSHEIFSGNKLSEVQVRQLLKEVLEVLTITHNKNIIHRDIKAQNLMRRNSDGKIVLIDFGTVKEISQLKNNPQELTNSHFIVGTHGYMPMEQLHGYPNLSSDIYAVGMLGIYALTGIRPQELSEKKDPNTFEIIWRDKVSVSPDLANVLDKMVRLNFNERYQTAGEALQALTTLSLESTIRTPPPPPSSEPIQLPPPSSSSISPPSHFFVAKQRFLIGAGVIVSLLLGMGLLFMTFSSRQPAIDVKLVCPETPLPPLPSTGGRKYGTATLYGFSDEKYPSGKGIMVFPDTEHGGTSRFDGELKDGDFHGCGSYRYGNGDRYVGQFVKGERQGVGKITYHNGCEYSGYFERSEPNGQGTCKLKHGLPLRGIWHDNTLQGSNQTCTCK
ncbi:MAG: protein kinase [Brasilonema angustatum HA4187-MV1]|jgi:serine/threonine protein kinase|nr:protein kinase [Brasilonema angustatum HA4187-MV1]